MLGRRLGEEKPLIPRFQPRKKARPPPRPPTEVSPPRKRPGLMALASGGSGRQDEGPRGLALGAGATYSKVVWTVPYQLEDAHGFCVVLYWQPREGHPQGYCQHPKGRFLRAQGRPMGTEPGLTGTSGATALCQLGAQEPRRQGFLSPMCRWRTWGLERGRHWLSVSQW